MRRSPLIAVALVLALAGVHTLRGVRASAAVERELAKLEAEGLLDHPGDLPESAEVRQARSQLEEWLAWIAERQELPDGRWFGTGLTLDARDLCLIEIGLAERQPFFDGIEALPPSLWNVPCAPPPPDGCAPRVMRTRAAVNALAVRARVAARRPEGAREAAVDLARALAILRVVDHGQTFAALVHRAIAGIAIDTLDRILDEGIVDGGVVVELVEPELELLQGSGPLELGLIADVRDLHRLEGERRGFLCSPRDWLSKPAVLGERVEFLRHFRRLRLADTASLLAAQYAPSESSYPVVSTLGPDGPYWMCWRGALHDQERLRGWIQAVVDSP